jgi:uncharacterized protein (DUF924 family)
MHHKAIIEFWFGDISPKQWWRKDPEFDRSIRERFGAVHAAATRGELYQWRNEPEGRLAEIIVLDQFSRNIYRGLPLAFAFDPLALVLAQEAISGEVHRMLAAEKKAFLYMPFMHSESPIIHEIAVRLYSEPGLENQLEFELKHKDIIDRFGRYPHRNAVLGRTSTKEEKEFLLQQGSSF